MLFRYVDLVAAHLYDSFLNTIPQRWQDLVAENANAHEPKMGTFIIAHEKSLNA